MGELSDLGRHYAHRLRELVGEPVSPATEERAQALTAEYCRQVKQRWGIDVKPVIGWGDDDHQLIADVEPVTELDRAMWERLQVNDTRLWMFDPRSLAGEAA